MGTPNESREVAIDSAGSENFPTGNFRIATPFQDCKIVDSSLSQRAKNCLISNGIRTFGDLEGVPIEQVARFRNIGRTTIAEIVATVGSLESGTVVLSEEEVYVVPTKLRDIPIEAVFTNARAVGQARTLNVRLLGDLHGLSVGSFTIGCGIGRGTREAIRTSLEKIGVRTAPFDQAEFTSTEEDPDRSAQWSKVYSELEARVFNVPAAMRSWEIDTVGLSPGITNGLTGAGIKVWGDLEGVPHVTLQTAARIGLGAIHKIVKLLESASKLTLGESTNEATRRPPNGPLLLLHAVETAQSPEEEVTACLFGLSTAHAAIVRSRWKMPRGQRTKLDEIAASSGLTRQRVQQIVTKRNNLLNRAELKLSRCSELASLIHESASGLTEAEFVKAIGEQGLQADSETIHSLESLSELGLVPPIFFDRQLRVFRAKHAKGSESDEDYYRELNGLRQICQRQLSEVGCIDIMLISIERDDVERTVSLSYRRKMHFARQGNYLVPSHAYHSRLLRHIHKMVRLSPGIEFQQIQEGLQRMRTRRLDTGMRIPLPPTHIVRSIVTSDRALEIAADLVTPTSEAADRTLNEGEILLVDVIEQNGGAATLPEIRMAFQNAGYSNALVGHLLGKPFICKLGPSLWGVRGRTPSRDTFASRLTESRTAAVKEVDQNALGLRVVYELTSSGLKGALPLPVIAQDYARTQWTARATCGEELPLSTANKILQSLNPWLANEKAKLGDILVATFYVDDGFVDLELPS
jgi:hypothetical protein